jgi:hypothetical protein
VSRTPPEMFGAFHTLAHTNKKKTFNDILYFIKYQIALESTL